MANLHKLAALRSLHSYCDLRERRCCLHARIVRPDMTPTEDQPGGRFDYDICAFKGGIEFARAAENEPPIAAGD